MLVCVESVSFSTSITCPVCCHLPLHWTSSHLPLHPLFHILGFFFHETTLNNDIRQCWHFPPLIHFQNETLNYYWIIISEQHKKEEPSLKIETIVLGVYEHLCSTDDEDGLQILTVISREYPDLVNKLLLDKLLDKVTNSLPPSPLDIRLCYQNRLV